jgi:signal transduction histidine kinase
MIEKWKGQKGYSNYEYIISESPRFTGYFDGDEFVLLDVDMDHHSFSDIPDWRSAYDGEIKYEGETVFIYPDEMVYDRCDVQVTVMDRQWELENLADNYARNSALETDSTKEYEKMLGKRDLFEWDSFQELWNNEKLFESVITRSGTYLNEDGENCEFVVVLRVQPMRIAVAMLAEVYLMTFIPLALILFFFCRRIRRELINPLGHILGNSDLEHAVALHRMTPRYREPLGLLEIFNQAQEDIHELKKENTKLSTALDYAHNAEENRRRMVSNITHELKTPLAVIHGYAEGLKEGIAADKQEHYLDVMLEEAQRMDGMVLEMLDLSRLEAGKVRLATDRFNLLELIKRVVDKMNLLVEERELKVEYVWKQEVEVTADEGRIAQAVTNLVSNAIKYSPRGGTIYVSVTRVKDKTLFSIENQSEPLSEEALNSIWDSFYRADASRTEKGTGLGLPITKAIVELHGGECQVSNTSTGVEFKFYLP